MAHVDAISIVCEHVCDDVDPIEFGRSNTRELIYDKVLFSCINDAQYSFIKRIANNGPPFSDLALRETAVEIWKSTEYLSLICQILTVFFNKKFKHVQRDLPSFDIVLNEFEDEKMLTEKLCVNVPFMAYLMSTIVGNNDKLLMEGLTESYHENVWMNFDPIQANNKMHEYKTLKWKQFRTTLDTHADKPPEHKHIILAWLACSLVFDARDICTTPCIGLNAIFYDTCVVILTCNIGEFSEGVYVVYNKTELCRVDTVRELVYHLFNSIKND